MLSRKSKTQIVKIEAKLENHLNIQACIKYKPEDESEHQTDRYGYAQTELQPVVRLRNLSEEEVVQVKKFVEDTMAEETIHSTRQKSLAEKLQDQVSKAIE